MPIYEYVCDACGQETEIMHRMSDPPATECPHCHAEKLVKQVSAAGFRLKGAGWYETDFKQDKKRNLVGDTPPVTKADDQPAAGESKPAKTADSSASPAKTNGSGSGHATAAAPAPAAPGKTPTPS